MERVLRLRWDEQTQIEVQLLGEAVFQDFVVVRRLNAVTGDNEVAELSAPWTYSINGLIRCSHRHLLIGIRNSVICFDVEQMAEVCRARQNDEGAPLEEDAVEEECLSPGGFDFDAARRRLYMLNGYFDEAALSCYELRPDFKSFRRLYRREVCGYCPRGLSDQLAARGICLMPESGHVAAVFVLEHVSVPLDAQQEFQGLARLCWVAEFSEQQDLWIEIVRKFDNDFLGDIEPMSVGPHRLVQFASADDWYPQPVALDDHRIAFATKTGKILATNLNSGFTESAYDCKCEVNALEFNPTDRQLTMATTHGIQKLNLQSNPLPATSQQGPVTRFARRPHKPKRYRPKVQTKPTTHVLSWALGQPVAITPDGKFAVAGHYVIDLENMKTVCVIPRFVERIRQVAITRDASLVLIDDGVVHVLDGRSGVELNKLSYGNQFALSPCEQLVALVNFNELTIWDCHTGKQKHRIAQGGSCVSWSPDGKHIAFGGWRGETTRKPDGPGLMCLNDDSICILDANTGAIVGHWTPGSLNAICWTHHGLLVGIKGSLENWDPLQVTKTGEFFVGDGIWRLSPDHNYLAIASNYGWTKRSQHTVASVFSVPDGKLFTEIIQDLGVVTDVSISFANERILVSSDRLRLYRPTDGQWIADVGAEWGRYPVTHLATSSARLATRDWKFAARNVPPEDQVDQPIEIQESIRVWDMTDAPECIFAAGFYSGLSTSERTIAISADGKRIAVPTQNAVLVWNVGNSEPIARIKLNGDSGNLLQLSPDGERLVVPIGNDILLFGLELNSLEPAVNAVHLVGHSQRVCAVSFSEDSAWLASGSADQSVKLWSLKDQASGPRTFFGAEGGIWAVGYLPEMDFIAASSDDKVIRLWDASSGKLVHVLDGPSNQVCRQLLPIDSRRLAAKYSDQVWIWDLEDAKPKSCLNTSCHWVGKNKADQIITSWNGEYMIWTLRPGER